MKITLRRLQEWSPRLLLVAMGLCGVSLFAQTPGGDPTTAQQPTSTDKDKKPAAASGDAKPAAQQPASDKDKKPGAPASGDAKPAAQTDSSDKDKKAPAKADSTSRQPDLGVFVDSARKSDALATWITSENDQGQIAGPYIIKQSAEFGGRITGFTGNPGTWDTFVNLGSGPRLMEYTLDIHSPKHDGLLFDDFLLTNFGYGGDPNNVSRVRMQKGKIYSFTGSFRRDQNIFDYDLLANPLNPPTSNPNVPILNSPHEFLMTRRMSDANLTLFPVGDIRFKLGWSHVVNQGTTFSSDHQGTEGFLMQPTLNTADNYNFGVSLRMIPRTSINYDQFFTYFKGDTSAVLTPPGIGGIFGLPAFTLSNGVPVQLGLPFNTVAGQPCATPVLGTGFANPACNGFISYNRSGNLRNSYPTEQFSFQSGYFHNVDFSGRINYSDAEADMPSMSESFNGLKSSSRVRAFQLGGGSVAHRISLAGDFAVTINVTKKFRIVDTFRYDAFRIPGSFSLTTATQFGATLLSNPNFFSPATCPPPFTAATCPQHNASSSADLIVDNRNDYLGQSRKVNTFLLEYDFTRRISAHAGYRFEQRDITQRVADVQIQTFFPGPTAALANRGACAPAAAHPLNPDGTCTVAVPANDIGSDFAEINGHTGLIGFSARPTDQFRISADAEFFSADNTFFRITPRHLQDYRIRVNYKPQTWVNLSAAVRILENRNTTADVGNLQHNRSYAFSGVFAPPTAKWDLDVSYNYNDIFSRTNICFVATPNIAPPGTITCGTPFLSGLSVYSEISHFASGSFVIRPWKRVTAGVGYALTSTAGNTTLLNPIAPTGPLAFNYHLPTASLAIQLSKNLTYKAGWNYYDYNEKSDPGPTLPRDFRGNAFTLSLRYSM